MQFKNLSLVMVFLFFSKSLDAQIGNHPCLDIEKMQKKMHEIAQQAEKENITSSSDANTKKAFVALKKFSNLSQEEQKAKVEKLLASETKKAEMVDSCDYMLDVVKNKKFDEQSLEKYIKLANRIEQSSFKEQFLCRACGELLLEGELEDLQTNMNELETRTFFYIMKKDMKEKGVDKLQELKQFEEKACEFGSLFDFLSADNNFQKIILLSSNLSNSDFDLLNNMGAAIRRFLNG